MTYLQMISFIIYTTIQVIAFAAMTSEMGSDAYKEMVIRPYRDGITLGDVFIVLLFLPALLLNMLILKSLPFILDAFCYVIEIRLTKPRPKQ